MSWAAVRKPARIKSSINERISLELGELGAEGLFLLLLPCLLHEAVTNAVEQRVLLVQRGIEQRRVIRIDGHDHSGIVQGAEGMRRQVGVDAEPDIAGWADLQRNTMLSEVANQLRILGSPHAVADPLRAEDVDSPPDARSEERFPGMRRRVQP